MNNSELWKAIPEYEGMYEVSNMGNVRRIAGSNCKSDRLLKPAIRGGYLHISLCRDGRAISKFIHQLVLLAFAGCSNGLWVNHLNGNKLDNRIENLEYVTPGGNIKHAYETGLMPDRTGDKNPNSTLSADTIRKIRKMNSEGYSRKEIREQTGVSQTGVRDIILGISWKNLDTES